MIVPYWNRIARLSIRALSLIKQITVNCYRTVNCAYFASIIAAYSDSLKIWEQLI